ncbi:sensor histidine kinase [Acetobacterium paludosum]|uniref:histidine kinase n=1 Tax=Acetobacterium paludosum TaxID=52693 RepID=A0A923I0E4_9FIRM|nr:sensor histidine kinase [Acetobacterium paludosum]MBC3886830.1 sensor histidine kinase [Acetobacterium paludosum]
MEDSLGSVIVSYLKARIRVILAFVLFIFIFAIVYFLYQINLEPLVYSIQLIGALAFVLGVWDFSSYYKKLHRMIEFRKAILVEMKPLPKPKDEIEEEYQKAIRVLVDSRFELIVQAKNNQKELNDYYTLWAHQIKTPISAMDLLLQTQAEKASPPAELRQELFKIKEYVEMVLQYLRLESMSSDLILKEYDLLALIQGSVKKYSIIFINKRISLELEEMDCTVLTDKKWLTLVLEQIISNALKYTPRGKISIYMNKNKEKTLVIEDTGVGIHPEDINRIFDRGFTGYNGRMDQKSTGIGLYLTKSVLDKLAHGISVESQLGVGTKIEIDLSRKNIELF